MVRLRRGARRRCNSWSVSAEERVHERLRFKWCQVVGALTETDELDGDAEISLHGDDDAALRRTVQLGQYHSGYVDHLGEDAGLRQPVLPGGGVEHEQGLVDRPV